jgi:hypothetical protein
VFVFWFLYLNFCCCYSKCLEGGRINIPVGQKQTAADVIAEVVRKIAANNSEQFAHRMFGLATLDGALLGPAMTIV